MDLSAFLWVLIGSPSVPLGRRCYSKERTGKEEEKTAETYVEDS